MTRRITLVERGASIHRLSRADAAVLAAEWPHAVDVVPTHDKGRYRLTARGWVGTFATPSCTWELVPKLGWAAAGRLVSAGRLTGLVSDHPNGLRSALATRLADLMAERHASGLVRGYTDATECSALVRGRIDFAASACRPEVGFAQVVNQFSTDVPWNGWPLLVANRLLAGPLNASTREHLQAIVDGFEGISPHPRPAGHLLVDHRLTGYRELLTWCGLVEQSLAGTGLLVNLEQLFEAYVGRLVAVPYRGRESVVHHELWVRGPAGDPGVLLRPDLTVFDTDNRPSAVWDVKWKTLPRTGPKSDDLHQVLGYAAALGVRSAGLLYPGRRFSVRRYVTPSRVAVTVATCRLLGDPTAIARAEQSVRRLVLGT